MKFALLLFLLLIPISQAHMEGGEDRVVGDYLIDFGYSPATPLAGESTLLAINLVNDSTRVIIAPESVWVRISEGDNVIFAGRFHPEPKHVTFTFTFPKPGNYSIDMRFVHGPNPETTFNMKVEGKEEKPSQIVYLGVAGLLVILAIVFYVTFVKK